MTIPEHPLITAVTPLRNGYQARALCRIDGFPAEVRTSVDTENQRYSEYSILLWNPHQLEWSQVHRLSYDEVGHMPPLLIAEQEVIANLNDVARALWRVADAIVRIGRERQEDIDAAAFVRENTALDEARERFEEPEPAALTIEHGEIVQEAEVL